MPCAYTKTVHHMLLKYKISSVYSDVDIIVQKLISKNTILNYKFNNISTYINVFFQPLF